MFISIKRFLLSALCSALLCIGLSGCSSSSQSTTLSGPTIDNKIRVLVSTRMIEDLVKGVGGDEVSVVCLMQGDVDPHSYEIVKGDDEKFSFAQVVIYNGLGLEHGASIRYRLENHENSLAVGDALKQKAPHLILYTDGAQDPHIWMDVSLWAECTPIVAEKLSSFRPEKREYFLQNAEATKQKYLKTHHDIYKQLHQIPENKRYLVTSHDAFHYFAHAYLREPNENPWTQRCCAPEGLAPEGQLSVKNIQEVVNHLLKYHIEVVFTESNVSADSVKKIIQASREKGLQVRAARDPLYADAMGEKGTLADSYLGMMQYDTQVLCTAWSQEGS